MSASLGLPAPLRLAYHRLVVLMDVKLPSCFPLALPLLLPGCGRQGRAGRENERNSAACRREGQGAFLPAFTPSGDEGACLSVPRGQGREETAEFAKI